MRAAKEMGHREVSGVAIRAGGAIGQPMEWRSSGQVVGALLHHATKDERSCKALGSSPSSCLQAPQNTVL